MNEPSTLYTITEELSRFLPCIQITTSAVRIQLGPHATYSPQYAYRYEGVFRLDNSDYDEDSQCWALYVGENKDPSEQNLRIKKRLTFLLVEEANAMGKVYRRIGLWFLNCLQWPYGKKRGECVDKFLNQFGQEEDREVVEQGTFRIV